MTGEKKRSSLPKWRAIITENATGYCESTSLHGFSYWVSAPRVVEKIFWVIVVATAFVFATIIIK